MEDISTKDVERAREVDLLTYLQRTAPQELVKEGVNVYATKTHDSLKISNGKWFWWSRGIGGVSALDYLIKVEEMPFREAVEQVLGERYSLEKGGEHEMIVKTEFCLPEKHADNRRVFSYLYRRGIDPEIVNHCIKHGQLYEDAVHHNCVFVGFKDDCPRYAMLRGTSSSKRFVGEVAGSDKRFPFAIPLVASGITVFVFESAIDVLSFLSIAKMQGRNWRKVCCLSVGGVYRPAQHGGKYIPPALDQYLKNHLQVHQIVLCLDQDEAGRAAAAAMVDALSDDYIVIDYPPAEGKDYNEYLQILRRNE